jgi:uncharacterized protein
MAESRAPAGDLEGVLEELRSLSGEVISAAVVLGSGELGASTLAPGIDEQRYGAMLAALAGLARRTARENGGGGFSHARIKAAADEGYVLLVGLRDGATLAATTGPDARVGLVLYDMRNARKEVERALGSENGDGGGRS